MNDLITQRETEIAIFDYQTLNLPIKDVEFLKTKEISMKSRTHQVMIENGRDLLESKERIEHGAFTKWCEECLGIDRFRAAEYMRIAENFKCADSAHLKNINKTSLLLLSSPSVPESAREDILEQVESGKIPSIKDTSETIESHKEVERLKAEMVDLKDALNNAFKPQSTEPTTYPLIPQLKDISGELMPAMIRKLETSNPDIQLSWYSERMGEKVC